jgi:hypothetical protein
LANNRNHPLVVCLCGEVKVTFVLGDGHVESVCVSTILNIVPGAIIPLVFSVVRDIGVCEDLHKLVFVNYENTVVVGSGWVNAVWNLRSVVGCPERGVKSILRLVMSLTPSITKHIHIMNWGL